MSDIGESCEPNDSAYIQMNNADWRVINTRGHIDQEAKQRSTRVEENKKGQDEWWRGAQENSENNRDIKHNNTWERQTTHPNDDRSKQATVGREWWCR